ncbi:hypothetical protein I8G32_03958 [Rhodopseudomonas palustris]|nr:hypothetical protein B1S06_06285 [Rhodopseudomonas palustris]QQM05389.1 hypothetical protein I8G32_03958 [Rhodopseudomonas palustris]
MKRYLPVLFLFVAGVFFYAYLQTKLPAGYQSKGLDDWSSVILFVCSIVSMVAAVASAIIQFLFYKNR